MTISVLMAVYVKETAENFRTAIDSIWTEQTLRPDQVVLVEDGPLTDELYEIVNHWKQQLGERMCIVRNECNLGLIASLNRGIEYVTSDLIARMDSDDISMPNRFEVQHRYFETHPDVDVISGSILEFNEDNPNMGMRHYPQTHEQCLQCLPKASPFAHPAVMMRTRLFHEYGMMYDNHYLLNEDIALWFDMASKGFRFGNVDDHVLNFRHAKDISSRRGTVKAWTEFKAYMNGIYKMNGLLTYKYIFPLARLVFRCMPTCIVQWGYSSRLRHLVTK